MSKCDNEEDKMKPLTLRHHLYKVYRTTKTKGNW